MSKRALVIEDEANIASLITEIMSLLQVDASHALSAGDGLKRIAAESFDFVLIDISLPDAPEFEPILRRALAKKADQRFESLTTFVADLNRCRPTLFLSVPRLWTKFQAGVFTKMPEKKLDFLLVI